MAILSSMAAPLLLIAALSLALWLLIRYGPAGVPAGAPVRAKRLLTANETEFLRRLRRALPEYEVLPQVSMGALLDANLPEGHPQAWDVRRRFAMKIIDFVVCRPGGLSIVTVVELDDRTHDAKRAQDAARDALLASAGIPTLRWDSRKKPSPREIAAKVRALAGAGG